MKLRNVAIIAHVDHGKTTLVDSLLLQSGALRSNQRVSERAMDSGDLERERGITILSKCTSITWGEYRINIVDTPGHADFGAEVERILGMVDGVLVLVDAAEGPMPQTKFVLEKALKLNLHPIVVINKVDRVDGRPWDVYEEVFELFATLDATESQLDFPIVFASARDGWAKVDLESPSKDLSSLFNMIIDRVPQPRADVCKPFSMLVTMLESDPFLGRLLTGRIQTGVIRPNSIVRAINYSGTPIEEARITKLLAFRGLKRTAIDEAKAGDIIAIAGFENASVSDTIADSKVSIALEAHPIAPPTIAVSFLVNDSPFAGEGQYLTSREIRARLLREAESNISIKVNDDNTTDSFNVSGRGELQLGILIETMRREGYEFCIGPPRVLQKVDPDTGSILEPMEEVQIDTDNEYVGAIVDGISKRQGKFIDMRQSGNGRIRLLFHTPSQSLIGYNSDLLTTTRGSAIMSRIFHSFQPKGAKSLSRHNGVLVSGNQGKSVAFALWNLEERGSIFIAPGDPVYPGMIIGRHSRPGDLLVNPLKSKQLTNIRASGSDEAISLTTPTNQSLEEAIAFINPDELVEVTPKSIRLRKRLLNAHDRKRAQRKADC